MKRYDVRCPACGAVNRSLFLEETDGLFECEKCSTLTRCSFSDRTILPMITRRDSFAPTADESGAA